MHHISHICLESVRLALAGVMKYSLFVMSEKSSTCNPLHANHEKIKWRLTCCWRWWRWRSVTLTGNIKDGWQGAVLPRFPLWECVLRILLNNNYFGPGWISLRLWIPSFLVNPLTGVSRHVCDSDTPVSLSHIRFKAALIIQDSHVFYPASPPPFLWEVETCPYIKAGSDCVCCRTLAAKPPCLYHW